QQQGRIRARRTLRKREQRRDAGVEDAVFRDGRHEAVGPRRRAILEIAQALVFVRSTSRSVRIDRDPLAKPDELVAPTARRALERTIAPAIEETRDPGEPVCGGDAAQKVTDHPL